VHNVQGKRRIPSQPSRGVYLQNTKICAIACLKISIHSIDFWWQIEYTMCHDHMYNNVQGKRRIPSQPSRGVYLQNTKNCAVSSHAQKCLFVRLISGGKSNIPCVMTTCTIILVLFDSTCVHLGGVVQWVAREVWGRGGRGSNSRL
jgi:predicted RNA-binding protein YlxR (DUF448 family)